MLVFVGAKMALVDVIKIPSAVSLLAIDTMLGTAIVASLWASRPKKEVRET